MKINSENNNSAVLSELGARIKRNRIDMQLSQQDFAAKSCCESCISIRFRFMRAPNSLRTAELLFSELIFIAYHLNKK